MAIYQRGVFDVSIHFIAIVMEWMKIWDKA
jgi:hypothetical protein